MVKLKLVGYAAHIEMKYSHKMFGKTTKEETIFAEWILGKVVW
jgi:hypothetical protein